MARPVYIYGLLNAKGNLFYVGKSIEPEIRLSVHKRRYGETITIQILEETDANCWEEREQYWIAEVRRRGHVLYNIMPGGEQPPSTAGIPLSDAHRREISKNQKRLWQDPKHRIKMKAAHEGHVHSEEHKHKISEAGKRRYQDPEERRKQSEIMQAQFQDPQIRDRIIAGQKRRWQDPQESRKQRQRMKQNSYRQNMSEQIAKKWQDPDYREKQEQSRHSEEHRRKRSEAAKKSWQDPEIRRKRISGLIGRKRKEPQEGQGE